MSPSFQFILIVCTFAALSCKGQTQYDKPSAKPQVKVGGGCEGCELMFEGMPGKMSPVSYSPGWNGAGQKLTVTGTVYQIDGRTPAANVIVYYWQTDSKGTYPQRAGMNRSAVRHGYIRGWIKTGSDGKYTINTIRPAPYPNRDIPAHIHLSIKEPGIANEYYTDDLEFDDDKLLLPYSKRYPFQNRGGSGILRVLLKGGVQIAEHDIVLGLNIANYPKQINNLSGLNIGEDQPSFTPFHAYGPDKGSQTCPVCKYGRFHGIVYFVGNKPDWTDIKRWLAYLERESEKRRIYLKAYFVYGNDQNYNKSGRQKELEKIGQELRIKQTALTCVPSFSDRESEIYLNKINPTVNNTFIVFKHSRIVDKYVNLEATEKNFNRISETLDRTTGEYFELKGVD